MGGLIALLFYIVFWVFCWKVSTRIVSRQKGKHSLKLTFCFLFLAGLPFWVYVYELVRYKVACANAQVFYPESKIEKPRVLITNAAHYKNPEGGVNLSFEYFVSPLDKGLRFRELYSDDFDFTQKIAKNYQIYARDGELVSFDSQQGQFVLNNVQYGFLRESVELRATGVVSSSLYIYDFLAKEKVSNIQTVARRFSQKNIVGNYLLPFTFPYCNGKANPTRDLFRNSFKEE